jgi:hypothetical protein
MPKAFYHGRHMAEQDEVSVKAEEENDPGNVPWVPNSFYFKLECEAIFM